MYQSTLFKNEFAFTKNAFKQAGLVKTYIITSSKIDNYPLNKGSHNKEKSRDLQYIESLLPDRDLRS